jgi:hypothetical protein
VSRRHRKKSRGAKFRPPVRSAPPAVSSGAPSRSVSQARVGGDQALVRAVEMSLGSGNQVIKGPRGRMIIQAQDPSIPLDRVPYFTADLVRLLVVGAAMVVLLAAGAFAIPTLVK